MQIKALASITTPVKELMFLYRVRVRFKNIIAEPVMWFQGVVYTPI